MLQKIKLNNGETYAYREVGAGEKTVVLIHGNLTSSKHWNLVLEQLQAKYHIYAVDLRGFGGSSYHQPINSLTDFAEDLKLWLDQLNLTKTSLIGWSTGGGVAMELAAAYPEQVDKLVLVASVGIKGYPIFRRDENQPAARGELLTTRAEIAREPLQIAPI